MRHFGRSGSPVGLRTLGALVLAAGLALSAQGQEIPEDDFRDGNDDGWLHYAPLRHPALGFGTAAPAATFQVSENFDYQIASAEPPDQRGGPARAGSLRPDAVFDEFLVRVDLTDYIGFPNQAVGILARVNDYQVAAPGQLEGYAFTFSTGGSGSLLLSRVVNEDPVVVADSSLPTTLDPAKDYRLVFRGVGGSLTGQIFDVENLATPLHTVTFTDPDPLPPGITGLVVFDNTDDNAAGAYFDNFAAAVPEPAALGLVAFAALAAMRRRGRTA